MKGTNNSEVVIIGGGLSGLSLALHLLKTIDEIEITLIEKKPHPFPEGTHSVGESTVEVGAEYLARVLDLEDHLQKEHFRKYGTRFFFLEGSLALEKRVELGGKFYPPTESYQIDRGRLENHMRDLLEQELRCKILQGRVKDIQPGSDDQPHNILVELHDTETVSMQAPWLVDASGRSGLLKRRLGLKRKINHLGSSAWFRLKGKLSVSELSSDQTWKESEVDEKQRWFSTNHLMGEGYWIWMIPLSTGYTSIGVVVDEECVDSASIRNLEACLEWISHHQPRLGTLLEKREIVDFCYLKDFAYSSEQVFSPERWALTGEAGVFLDPFYSPGTDYIGIGNTFIVDLIERDLAGKPFAAQALHYDSLYLRLFKHTLSIYEGAYPIFGNSTVMPLKIVWDFAIYWTFIGTFYFEQKFTDLKLFVSLESSLNKLQELNTFMQSFFRSWGTQVKTERKACYLNFFNIEYLIDLNRKLRGPHEKSFEERFTSNVSRLNDLAQEILEYAEQQNFYKVESPVTGMNKGHLKTFLNGQGTESHA